MITLTAANTSHPQRAYEGRVADLVDLFGITAEQAAGVVDALEGDSEMDGDAYDAIFSHYCDTNEIPYGTATAKDGDPVEWVHARVAEELGMPA